MNSHDLNDIFYIELKEIVDGLVKKCLVTWEEVTKEEKPEKEIISVSIPNIIFNNGVISSVSYTSECEEREIFFRIEYICLKKIKQQQEFLNLIEKLSVLKNLGKRPEHIAWIFCSKIFRSIYDESKNTAEISKTLIDELQDLPISYVSTIHLNNLVLRCGDFHLDERTHLRKIIDSDLKYEQGLFTNSDFNSNFNIKLFDSVCEIKIQSNGPRNIQDKITKLIKILRLFSGSAIAYSQYKLESKSIIDISGGTITDMTNLSNGPKLFISEDNKNKLINFYSWTENNIPERYVSSDLIEDEIGIAIKRYENALLLHVHPIEKLANGVIGLEALYLQNDGDSSYKFRSRITKMMSFFDCDTKVLSETLKDAYKIRSSYLHGSVLSDKKAEELLPTIFECLRRSILLFILLNKEGFEKKKVLPQIDYSFADGEENNKLKKKIEEVTSDISFNLKGYL